MDDQNQNNQPLDQGSVPVDPIASSVPLDITPQAAPPDITPPVAPSEPVSTPSEAVPLSPIPDVPPLPFPAPEIETDQPLPNAPVVNEPQMPEPKHKNKITPIIGGVVALLLVVGMAGATYYVSNQLSTRQAVAPNAPESEPLATTCNATTEFTCSCSCGTFCLPENATYGCAIECVNRCGGTPNYTTPPPTTNPTVTSSTCTQNGGCKPNTATATCCDSSYTDNTCTSEVRCGPNTLPTCGTGLSCSNISKTGATYCISGGDPQYCCPTGKIINGGDCVSSSVCNSLFSSGGCSGDNIGTTCTVTAGTGNCQLTGTGTNCSCIVPTITVAVSCGSGKTCNTYSSSEMCTQADGTPAFCTKTGVNTGNCCVPDTTQGCNGNKVNLCGSNGGCSQSNQKCTMTTVNGVTSYSCLLNASCTSACPDGKTCTTLDRDQCAEVSGSYQFCSNGTSNGTCCQGTAAIGNGGICNVAPITQASVNTPVCSGTQCIQDGWKEGSNGVACYKNASGCPNNNCQGSGTLPPVTIEPTQTACVNYTFIPNATSAQENQIICNPDKSKLGTVNFTNAGDVRIHLNGVSAGTTVSLTKSGASATVTKIDDNNFDATVQVGTYNIVIKLGNESTNSLGFIKPANGVCVRYGAPEDISSKITSAALTGYGIISTAGVDSPIQCWGDTIQGNDTNQRDQLDANYDFNDFNVEIGYKSSQTVVGACTLISVYKKTDGVYGSTPLTTEELQTLKVGDVLKFSLNSNNDNLKGRFGVTLNNGTVVWMSGVIDATNKRLITYSDYTVATAGTYKFEGQVTKQP